MATTVKSGGDWSVDVGDQLSQAFTLTEDGSAVDNWDDVVVQVDIFSSTYGTLTLRSDDADPQVVKSAGPTPTTATVTLTESDTSANFTGRYRIVVIDPTEDERTTHVAAPFRVVGNYAGVAPGTFSAVDLTSHLTSSSAHTAANIPVVDSGAYFTGTDTEAALAELGQRSGLAPITAEKTDADLPLVNTSGTWTDLDPNGTASSRPLDVVIPNVTAGQWVRLEMLGLYSNTAAIAKLDAATIVDGAAVNRISGDTTNGVLTWIGLGSTFSKIAGGISYQVQAGDLDDGAVRLRIQYISNGAKTIYAATAGYTLRIEGSGPFG